MEGQKIASQGQIRVETPLAADIALAASIKLRLSGSQV
jgi:hypothetical protein